MPQILTPARLATLVGVLTGLSAAATSLLNVFPKDTAVGRVIVGATGVLATVVMLAKFLEGQSAYELQQLNHVHALDTWARDPYRAGPCSGACNETGWPEPQQMAAQAEPAALDDADPEMEAHMSAGLGA